MEADNQSNLNSMEENFEDFFENSLCGFVTANGDGMIIRVNKRLADWIGVTPAQLVGTRFSDLLSIGGKIYYETHLWPLLRMQGFFDEVALELNCNSLEKLQVLVNGFERRDDRDIPQFVRLTIFKATDRRRFEQNLKDAKAIAELNLSNALEVAALREQFIAVLGHDLRNPLGSITAGISYLARAPLPETEAKIVSVLSRSAERMGELIRNVMDFARIRLGAGMSLERNSTSMAPVILHVIDELSTIWPKRTIESDLNIDQPINCDPARISQLLSNLVANAITHGASDTPVKIRAFNSDNWFHLSVSNQGTPIAANEIEHLFQPFTREAAKPSQQGLGLGLYIAAEISRAHGGKLTATSTTEETTFTFMMPVSA